MRKTADEFNKAVNAELDNNTVPLYRKLNGNGQIELTLYGLMEYDKKIREYCYQNDNGKQRHETNCPNCGAPLPSNGHCEYCGSIIK